MIVGQQTGKYFSSSKSVSAYLNDIRHFTVPTAEEEQELLSRAKSGDDKARTELLERNQRFIFSVAKLYARDESEIMDYVNEGTMGLNIAIDKYDPTFGTKFMTIGIRYIRRSMNAYLTDTRNIINRSNNQKFGNKIEKYKSKVYMETGRIPTAEEIAEALHANNVSDVYDLSVSSINEELSDDYTVEEESEFSLRTASNNDYENTAEQEQYKYVVERVLSVLPPKKKELIKKMFAIGYDEPYSMERLSEEYNMSEASITAVKNEAFDFIRKKISLKEVL